MNDYIYSVIIPHREIPDLLERCVKSIPDRDDVQIIVVDDNSKDNEFYLDLYPFLKRRNLMYIPTKEGRGAGYARNVGVRHATGKWLLFADSDDFFTDILVDVMDEYAESEHDVIFFGTDSVYCNDIAKKAPNTRDKKYLFDEYKITGDLNLFKVKYSEPWGKIVRRSIVVDGKIKFDETRVCNDFYFSVQVAFSAGSIGLDERILYVVTLREGSLCYRNADTLEKVLIRLDVFYRVDEYIRQHGIISEPMMVRGWMVALLKQYPIAFLRELCKMPSRNISVIELLYQIFAPKYWGRRKK